MGEYAKKTFESRSELDAALATAVADVLRAAIEERGSASLVVSGGSTPLGFFAALSKISLPWDAVVVTLADERWVPPEHDDSNARLTREKLLINEAASATFLPLYNGAESPEDAEDAVAETLASLGTFDVLILGMGDDAHTASLFPGSTALASGLDMQSGKTLVGVRPLTAPHARMSMTRPRLLDAHLSVMHLTGDGKMQVFENALASKNASEFPVCALYEAPERAPEVYWAP